MKFPNYEDYKTLKKYEKIKQLDLLWNTKNSMLKGTVRGVLQDRGYFFITNVTNLYDQKIINPFTNSQINEVHCRVKKESNFINGNKVVFSYTTAANNVPDDDKASEYNSVIRTFSDKVELLSKFEDVLGDDKNNKYIEELRKIIFDSYDKKAVFFTNDVAKILDDKSCEILDYIESLKEIENEINKNIDSKKAELQEIESQSEVHKSNIIKELEEIRIKKTEDIKREIEEYEKKIKELENRYRYYKLLGLEIEPKGYQDLKPTGRQDIEFIKDRIEYIWKHLGFRKEKPLFYDRFIIESLYAGLCSNQLIILSGSPGTGKTSLVEGFAEAMGAEYKLVSIQPNWTDNQDLIGIYNSVDNLYISTPFLDSLIEASNSPDKLFIICLDEMNLAHIEYYFSEFLSKLQSKEKTLELYSDFIYHQVKDEIRRKVEDYFPEDKYDEEKAFDLIHSIKNKNSKEYYSLLWKWNNISRYPSKMKIPDNIRFIGTVNKDETTKTLSPKVVDRSFVINIEGNYEAAKEAIYENEINDRERYLDTLYIEPKSFLINRVMLDVEEMDIINKLKESLNNINVQLNNRFLVQAEEIKASRVFENREKLLDCIISSMVLPKINVADSDIFSEIGDIDKVIDGFGASKDLFFVMKEYYDSEDILTFWR